MERGRGYLWVGVAGGVWEREGVFVGRSCRQGVGERGGVVGERALEGQGVGKRGGGVRGVGTGLTADDASCF